jgi:hypothetical protein
VCVVLCSARALGEPATSGLQSGPSRGTRGPPSAVFPDTLWLDPGVLGDRREPVGEPIEGRADSRGYMHLRVMQTIRFHLGNMEPATVHMIWPDALDNMQHIAELLAIVIPSLWAPIPGLTRLQRVCLDRRRRSPKVHGVRCRISEVGGSDGDTASKGVFRSRSLALCACQL